MGWGTTVQVYLNRITPDEMEDKIEDAEHSLQWARERLLVLAASTPRTVLDEHGNPWNWEEYIQSEIGDIMETIEEEAAIRFVCQQAIEWPGSIVPDEEYPQVGASSMDEKYSISQTVPVNEGGGEEI